MAESRPGYYRFPTLHDDVLIFTAEGDLWSTSAAGGLAHRLTSHNGLEDHAQISPDGQSVAFSGCYEGPAEVYHMPVNGGLPQRLTWEGANAAVTGWTPDGQVMYCTTHFSTLPNPQLVTIDPASRTDTILPLHQASQGDYDNDGVLYFTRLAHQGSHTKRYQGGSVEQLWRFDPDSDEATPLTSDYPGTSRTAMFWNGRIYFASDRDGTMNLYSMASDASNVTQHTFHRGWDVLSPSLQSGRVVYQLGADLHLYDIASDTDQVLEIHLQSDFDQRRTNWVQKPMEFLTDYDISSDGSEICVSARGRVFVIPAKQGRVREITPKPGVRFRGASFFPNDPSLLLTSDETGELEYWRYPISGDPKNGVRQPAQLTSSGDVYRFSGQLSPDGNWIAYQDKNQSLWLHNISEQKDLQVARSDHGGFSDLQWSADSRWLAYTGSAANNCMQIFLFHVDTQSITALTSDRVDSYQPKFSPDGRWLYFVSDRHFETVVASPWGPRQPEPYVYQSARIYLLALTDDCHSPYAPKTELDQEEEAQSDATEDEETGPAEIQLAGIADRLMVVPLPPGRYRHLEITDKKLLYTESSIEGKLRLMSVQISREPLKPVALMEEIGGFVLSRDRNKVLVHKKMAFYLLEADKGKPEKLSEKQVNLKQWRFTTEPGQEWRQMFIDAWRMERDFFYDRNLHGVDWQAQLDRHLPLVDRITDRHELNDLIAQMVGELAALHIFVRGGDIRTGDDAIGVAFLGARLNRDESAGGYRIDHIYQSEPDFVEGRAPLRQPGLDISEGDIIEAVDDHATLEAPDIGELLRNKAGAQVLLRVRKQERDDSIQRIITPIAATRNGELRYQEWEYTRRLMVEESGAGELGYVHMRAMTNQNYAEWVRHYYPVFNRKGLIVDVRHNRGGNIDSWILEKLMRRAWFYWQPRVGHPTWNMQYAFRGHMVALIDENTASDGEAFAEGFRRLGLGKLIGVRSWGGEIWLSMNNPLTDRGIASAAQTGVYSPEGEWLIEGHGVEPDISVDNTPHATFMGEDAQLMAAVSHLKTLIEQQPVEVPPAPPHPDKSFDY